MQPDRMAISDGTRRPAMAAAGATQSSACGKDCGACPRRFECPLAGPLGRLPDAAASRRPEGGRA